MAAVFGKNGFKTLSETTETHMILVDVSSLQGSAEVAETLLAQYGIFCNACNMCGAEG